VQYIIIQRRSNATIPLMAAGLLIGAAVIRIPCDDIRLSFRLVFEIAVVAGLGLIVWQFNRWIASFLGLALISMMYPFYDRHSYLAFQAVFYGAAWYMLLVLVIDRDRVNVMLNAICILAFIHIAMLILQNFNMDPLFTPVRGGRDVPVGLMSNRNMVSALLAFCFPAFLRRGWAWGIPVVLLGLLLAKSTGGAMALAAGMVFYCVIRAAGNRTRAEIIGNVLILAAVAVGIIIFCGYVDRPNFFNARLDAWINALRYYEQHWIMGAGIGHWKDVFQRHMLTGGTLWWTTAHNEYLQGLFEMGIGFALILFGYFQAAARRYLALSKQYRAAAEIPATALVVILVNSLVNFPFRIATTAMMAITWMTLFDIRTIVND